MRKRHTLALLPMLLAGCFGSHDRDGREEPAVDAGRWEDPDASVEPPDDPPEPGPMPAPTCGRSDAIAIEVLTLGTRACAPGVHSGSSLYGVHPLHDGLQLDVDLCPDADEDCRCSLLVHGISPSAHEEMVRVSSGVTVTIGETAVAIEVPAACTPEVEHECVSPLVFAAMDGSLESPPIDPEALDVAWGASVCSGPTDPSTECTLTSWDLAVLGWTSGFPGAIGFEQRVREGETVLHEGNLVMFQAVRTTTMACRDARFARTAAWAAWAAH